MRRLVRAATYAQLLDRAADFLRAHRDQEVLLVAPTRGAADDLLRLRLSDSAGVHRVTMAAMTRNLVEEDIAERGLAPLNALGAEALVVRAIYLVRREARLRYFEPVASSPGFARAVARTLRELRIHRITPEQVAATGAPGRDLALLQTRYTELLAESRHADYPEMLRLATARVEQGGHRWVGLPLLLLDVALDAGLPRQLVQALAAKAPQTLVTLVDADEASGELYLPFMDQVAEPAQRVQSTLDRLRAQLFRSGGSNDALLAEAVAFFSAAGEGLECTEIARRLHRLAEGGTRFDEMAILLRDAGRYQPLLEEALSRAGVPCHFSHGSVRPDTAGRAFLALLYCAFENYPATRFAEYLSLGQMPVTPAEKVMAAGAPMVFGSEDELLDTEVEAREKPEPPMAAAPPSTPAQWEQLLVDAAVIGGRDRWARRLDGLENEFRFRLAKLDEGDVAERAHVERQLSQLAELKGLALPVMEQLSGLPKAGSWREWIDQLSGLAQATLRYPESVQTALHELWSMGDAGPVTLEEVLLVLEERLRFLRRPPLKSRYGGVWIGSIDEARGQSFAVVFVPGLAEGIFPKKAFEDPLLLDTYRRRLNAGLPLRETRVADERLRLHIAAAAARTQLIVSYPRMDVAQSRSRVPSFYAMEVVRAAEGRLPELKELERRSAAAASTRLGWPFPAETKQAVDALEFDLSVLQRALLLPRGQAKGHGRYLLETNAHLARALRSRFARWSNKWAAADGLIVKNDAAAMEVLERLRLRSKPWSASSLQLMAACPYRFVLHGLFHLRPREEMVPLEAMDPLTRGSLFHEVQFELFRQARSWEIFEDVADEVLDRVAAKYEDQLAPAIPRVWKTELEDLRADLHGWLRRLQADAAGWDVIHSEYAFGMTFGDERDPASTAQPARVRDGVLLRGSVDWIEQHRETGELRITDHKTGRTPKDLPRYVGKGQYLQPLLYAAAVEQLLGRTVKFSRLYFCTQRGGYDKCDVPVTETAQRYLSEVLELIDWHMANGLLPAAPAPEQCKWCDFTSVCGPREEERVRRKPVLVQLQELRSRP